MDKNTILIWAKKHPVWTVLIILTVIGAVVNLFGGSERKQEPNAIQTEEVLPSTKLTPEKDLGNATKLKAGVNSLLQICGGICLKASHDNEDITLIVSDQWFAEPEYQQERWVTVMAQAWMTLQKESGFSTDTSTLYVEDSYGKRLAKYSAVFGFSRS